MKNIYEKDQLLIFTSFFFIVIELFCFINLCFKNFRTFEMIQGVVVSDNYFKSYVDSKTIKKLKSIKFVYIDNKKYSFEIINIERKVLRKNKSWYHEILVRCKFPKEYVENDAVTITYESNKKKLYYIFNSCWKEEV